MVVFEREPYHELPHQPAAAIIHILSSYFTYFPPINI